MTPHGFPVHATVHGRKARFWAECALPFNETVRRLAVPKPDLWARTIKGGCQMLVFTLNPALRAAGLSLVLCFGGAVAKAEAAVPLADEAHINTSLVAAQAGDMVRNTCPTISARMFVVFDKMYALKAYARALGYTETEVKAFLADGSEKARVKALALDYLTTAGVVEGDVESYCRVGRDEIAKGTLMGSLLRSSQ